MHRWHHSTEFPDDPKFRYGCNYGVGVSFWDQLFGTFYLPKDEKGAVLSPRQLGHPEGYADEPNYLKMLIGLRAFPYAGAVGRAAQRRGPSRAGGVVLWPWSAPWLRSFGRLGRRPHPPRAQSALEAEVSLSVCTQARAGAPKYSAKETEGE